jgi:hypothetical protein
MNNHKRRIISLAGAFLLAAISPIFAQAPEKMEEELVKFKKGEIASQNTPQFSLGNVKEKNFKPKEWLEIEFELEAKQSKSVKDKKHFHDEVSMKYYVFLESTDAARRKTLTADINYVNMPLDENTHTVVYLSPTTLTNLTGSKIVDKGMIKLWGVEAYIGGKLVGFSSSNKMAWWKNEKAPPTELGRLQGRATTPFAPLWADYYVEEKAK